MFNFMKKGKIEYIIAGLGNPGAKYALTRHNAGFMAVDIIAGRKATELKKLKFHSLVADVMLEGKRCLLMQPQTMMNNSGEAIYEAACYYNIEPENIIIIYDDISLDVGKIRIRRKGSAGGHNGIKSIISCLGSEDFPRVKVGVGKKPSADYDLAAWVLGKIAKEHWADFDSALANAADAAGMIANESIDKAMNMFNS